MATTFATDFAGQVGVQPRDVRMLSDASAAEVTAPGFLNKAALEAGFVIEPTDVITAVYDYPQIVSIFSVSFSGPLITLVPVAGGTGESNTASNVGAGDGIFKQKVGANLEFKSLEAGSNITLTPTTNSVIVEAVIPNVGEANTSSNLGTGAGLAAAKVGVNLPFKSLLAGAGMSISTDPNQVTITSLNNGTITGGNNLGTANGVFANVTGSLMNFKSLRAGSNVTISDSGTELQISSSGGGGGGGFAFINTFFVAKGGSDSNAGTSIDSPFLTFQAAVNAAEALGVVPNVRNVIQCFDSGTYTDDITITNLCVDIYAPSANLSNCNLNMNVVAAATINNAGNSLTFNDLLSVNYTDNSTSFSLDIDVITFTFDTCYLTQIAMGKRSCTLKIDYWDQSGSFITGDGTLQAYTFLILGIKLAASVSGVSPTTNISLTSWVRTFGVIGQTSITGGAQLEFSGSGALSLDPKWSASSVTKVAGGDSILTIDNTINGIVPIGFEVMLVNISVNGNIFINVGGSVQLACAVNNPRTDGIGGYVMLRKITSIAWWAGGGIVNRNPGTLNVYVSQLSGSDTTGSGTLQDPFATIGAAKTFIGTPSNTVNIIINDDATYAENVNFSAFPNINLIGPQASMAGTGSGNTLVIDNNMIVTLSALSGANHAINCTGGTVFLNANNVQGPIANSGSAGLYIKSLLLNSALTNTGAGAVYYTADNFTGTAGAGVFGISPTGTQGASFNVEGALSVNSAFTFPSVDGTANQVLETNGAGVVSWQTVSGGSNPPGLYVSQTIGSDSNSGTFSAPFATFSHAITVAGSPTIPITIYGLDAETYAEDLVLPQNNVNINAPYATIQSITFSSASSTHIVNIGNMSANPSITLSGTSQNVYFNALSTAGQCVVNNNNYIFLKIDSVNNDIVTTGNGHIYLTSGNEQVGNFVIIPGSSGHITVSSADSPITGSVYVSKQLGYDSNLGTLNNPFATIGQAMSFLGASGYPGYFVDVVILDGSTYAENVVIPRNGINIYGPNATLQPSSGNALTTASSSTATITLLTISGPIAHNGNYLFLRCGNGLESNITSTSGNVTFTADYFLGNLTTTGGHFVGHVNSIINTPSISPGATGDIKVFYGDFIGYQRNGMLHQTAAQNNSLYTTVIFPDSNANIVCQDNLSATILLNGGGHAPLYTGAGGTSRYRIRQISLNYNAPNAFTGGNRNINITDGTTIYSTIPSATLLSQASNAEWGSTAVPYPVNIPLNQLTNFGTSLYAVYSGGTTDYTGGNMLTTIMLEKVVS